MGWLSANAFCLSLSTVQLPLDGFPDEFSHAVGPDKRVDAPPGLVGEPHLCRLSVQL